MIWSKIRQKVWQLKGLLIITSSIAGLVILGSLTTAYETFELSTFDLWFRLRSPEKRESRIVVVNIGESDIRELNQWPISDSKLVDLLEIIAEDRPRVIGLDIYRDIPQGDIQGQKRLTEFFRLTKNIVGVEKAIGEKVYAPSILKKSGQTAMADLVIDRDGKVRRGLISARTPDDRIILGLATKLALTYLAEEGITLQGVENSSDRVLGKAVFSALRQNEGGYVNADVGGYQVIVNWRGSKEKFAYTSVTEVLNRQIPPDLFKDKIVIIGSTASSLNDLFYTPYSSNQQNSEQMPGVYVHANLTSHIISSALDGRIMIRGVSEFQEWLWILCWSCAGGAISFILLEINLLQQNSFNLIRSLIWATVIPLGILWGINYGLFSIGLWLPTVAPLLAFCSSAIVVAGYQNQSQKNLAFTDGLTQIANRRFFDRYLEQQWWRSKKDRNDIALILCDVDFFKVYNDTYGHQAGDECLTKVAKAIRDSVRNSDLPARYGGEEFVVVLPNTEPQGAILVAHKIRFALREMQIPHHNSQVSSFVTISCGIASMLTTNAVSPEELIAHADRALYSAKEQGRDCAVIADL